LATSGVADELPRYIGRSSCATATCHGGIAGIGPAWHSSSSVFEASDPHARAGDVLLNDLSIRIVEALEPSASGSDELFARTLQTRCVSCHAPEIPSASSATSATLEPERLRRELAAGVSCEACHGPASVWEKLHTGAAWAKSARFTAALGMLDTESPLARADDCARCHVGSRPAEGPIRDMNHDMIAAGHPPLSFDMLRYQTRLPPHWAADREALATAPAQESAPMVDAWRTRVLLAALRLSAERRSSSAHSPQPELSEYDCTACHHQLQLESPRERSGSTGSALWHPWYTAGQELPVPREELRLDRPGMGALLHTLEEPVRQRSEALMQAAQRDPETVQRGSQ
jgi:hypothetical protein